MKKFSRTSYEVHMKYVPHDSWGEIRKWYCMSISVPVMQYIRCCGRGVVSRLVMCSVAHANVLSSRKFDTTFRYATNMLNSNTTTPPPNPYYRPATIVTFRVCVQNKERSNNSVPTVLLITQLGDQCFLQLTLIKF